MQALILKLLTPLVPYILGGALLAASGFYVVHLRRDIATEVARNAALSATAAANTETIARYAAQQDKWNAELDALDAQTLATRNAASGVLGQIAAAPAHDDAPVAPVLSRALADIRNMQAGQ